jgi:hypothetical protein
MSEKKFSLVELLPYLRRDVIWKITVAIPPKTMIVMYTFLSDFVLSFLAESINAGFKIDIEPSNQDKEAVAILTYGADTIDSMPPVDAVKVNAVEDKLVQEIITEAEVPIIADNEDDTAEEDIEADTEEDYAPEYTEADSVVETVEESVVDEEEVFNDEDEIEEGVSDIADEEIEAETGEDQEVVSLIDEENIFEDDEEEEVPHEETVARIEEQIGANENTATDDLEVIIEELQVEEWLPLPAGNYKLTEEGVSPMTSEEVEELAKVKKGDSPSPVHIREQEKESESRGKGLLKSFLQAIKGKKSAIEEEEEDDDLATVWEADDENKTPEGWHAVVDDDTTDVEVDIEEDDEEENEDIIPETDVPVEDNAYDVDVFDESEEEDDEIEEEEYENEDTEENIFDEEEEEDVEATPVEEDTPTKSKFSKSWFEELFNDDDDDW